MLAVDIIWPGGEHPFRLGLEHLRAIQTKTDCGPEYLAARIAAGQWRIDDLREVIRLGLIGGGMDHVTALRLVNDAFDTTPAISFKTPAWEILNAFLYGPADDPVGEAMPVTPTPAPNEQTANGSSAPITD